MKKRRIRVLMAKGWYVAVWCVSYSLFSMICSFASAQKSTDITVEAQDVVKAGDIISGTVSDSNGPMMMVNVVERDSSDRIVAHSITDLEGRFSFRLVNPKDRIYVAYVGYEIFDTAIDRKNFDVKLKEGKWPDIEIVSDLVMNNMLPASKSLITLDSISMDEFEGLGITTVEDNLQAYGAGAGLDLVWNSGSLIDRPQLVLDGNIIIPESTAWAGFDVTKTEYSKHELSRLFGVKARKIKSVTVLKGEAATKVWGTGGRAGVIEVQTKNRRSN